MGGGGLVTNLVVGLIMVGAALGMTGNHVTGSRVFKHGCGNISRMGARDLAMAILSTHGDSGSRDISGNRGDKNRRRTDKEVTASFDLPYPR